MNREEFSKLMEHDHGESYMCGFEYMEMLKESVNRCDPKMKCVVIMEELAELSQEIAKFIRNDCDSHDEDIWIGLLEEMADVRLCLDMLQELADISDLTLSQAMNIKLRREHERGLVEGGKK